MTVSVDDNKYLLNRKSNFFLHVSYVPNCTPFHLVAVHCKLGEIFLLKTLKHKKSRKLNSTFGIYSSILVGVSVY